MNHASVQRSSAAPIRLVVFPGGFNWPVWVAQAKGLFGGNGVTVEVTPTPGSVFQLAGLIEGRFDMAITLIDNVIAYREGQGEIPVTGPDLIAVMAADTCVYPALVTLPEIRQYADLRGKTLSVDAMTTGYRCCAPCSSITACGRATMGWRASAARSNGTSR
jgi:ABC-type nitrate/sulfonate/bicarbonate transport system substrate-binding protein